MSRASCVHGSSSWHNSLGVFPTHGGPDPPRASWGALGPNLALVLFLEMWERRHDGGHVEYRIHLTPFEVMQLYLEAVEVETHGTEANCRHRAPEVLWPSVEESL